MDGPKSVAGLGPPGITGRAAVDLPEPLSHWALDQYASSAHQEIARSELPEFVPVHPEHLVSMVSEILRSRAGRAS